MPLNMIKIAALIIISVALLVVVVLGGFSLASRKQVTVGLVNQQLRPCPDTPNCVCSEDKQHHAFIQALSYQGEVASAWQAARQAIIATDGKIVSEHPDYLHALYVTPLLRFRDDVELRLDRENRQIHIRSSSRTGRSDLGTNRKRVEHIRSSFGQILGAKH